eukprot:2473396-Rhodomonas_salina.1
MPIRGLAHDFAHLQRRFVSDDSGVCDPDAFALQHSAVRRWPRCLSLDPLPVILCHFAGCWARWEDLWHGRMAPRVQSCDRAPPD